MEYRERFELGIREFNEGLFFESHDTFEEIWMEQRGERRRFMQGLIQASVGLFHASRRNYTGANSQLGKGLAKLAEYRPRFLGVDVDALYSDLAAVYRSVQSILRDGESSAPEPMTLPLISYSFDPATMSDF